MSAWFTDAAKLTPRHHFNVDTPQRGPFLSVNETV